MLSPTHLHEFKSADKTGVPVMSLYLPEQKLGSHSTEGGSSNKFILKGRQTGTMHRGHTWVFRAESHDTMMAWYEDIKALTEKSPEELSNFFRGHARTYSRTSQRSVSSDGMVDEEDDVPFSPDPAVSVQSSRQDSFQHRPHTGGRFPSDIQVNAQRGLLVPVSPTVSGSGLIDNEAIMRGAQTNGGYPDQDLTAAAALPGSGVGDNYPDHRLQVVGQSYGNTSSVRMDQAPSHAAIIDYAAREDGVNPYSGEPVGLERYESGRSSNAPIVVDGLVVAMPTGASQTSRTSISGFSEESGISGSVDVWPSLQADRNMIQNVENPRGSMVDGTPLAPQNSQGRPGGQRNNSTPHVPGEYPRTPGATPAL